MPRTVTRGARLSVVPVSSTKEIFEGQVAELTSDQAEAITAEILAGLNDWHAMGDRITTLALHAFYGRAFEALGYQNWNAYARAKFSGCMTLPRAAQSAINAALINGGGISARSAAAITGTDHKTAAKDAAKAEGPTGEDSPVVRPRTGADGKKRAARKAAPSPPCRDEIIRAAEVNRWDVPFNEKTQINCQRASEELAISFTRAGSFTSAYYVDQTRAGKRLHSKAALLNLLQTPADNFSPIRHEEPEPASADEELRNPERAGIAATTTFGTPEFDPLAYTLNDLRAVISGLEETATVGEEQNDVYDLLLSSAISFMSTEHLENRARAAAQALAEETVAETDRRSAEFEYMQNPRKPRAIYDDRTAKLLNKAMGTDSDEEAMSAFLFARKTFREPT